jgi:hypothetical protein
MVDHNLADPAEYRHESTTPEAAKGGARDKSGVTAETRIPLEPGSGKEIRIRIWTIRGDSSSRPVTVYVQNNPGGASRILRIERL